jgi:hypothetical protein
MAAEIGRGREGGRSCMLDNAQYGFGCVAAQVVWHALQTMVRVQGLSELSTRFLTPGAQYPLHMHMLR